MSQARVDVAIARRIFTPKFKGWLELGRQRLYKYRPRFRDRHFWLIQIIVIGIAAIHNIFEAGGFIQDMGVLYFLPLSMLLVPVIYAALNFGFAGAMATAMWATAITIPNFIFAHQGSDRFFEIFQMLMVVAVAAFVGQRVDREISARQRAEAAGALLRVSEIKYRGLFESSPIAILILDLTGTVLEANPAASILFGRDTETLKTMSVADLVGREGAQKLLSSSQHGKWSADSLVFKLRDKPKVYLEPTLTQVSDTQDNLAIQVLFRDVTEEQQRQAGLKAYAAYVLRAQEEERQRIARELHDETIQALVLLCRQLDSIEDTGDSLPSWVIDRLRVGRSTAEEVVKGLRDFATALRPPILDDLGLMASIRRLLMDFTERAGVEGEIKIVGDEKRLPADIKLGIFRIVQEALWNAERHAKATRLMLTIAFDEHGASLEVADNGVGFTITPASGDFATSGQLGLIGMQERAELLGGKLKIQSDPGKGTRVTLSVPFLENVSEVSNHRPDG